MGAAAREALVTYHRTSAVGVEGPIDLFSVWLNSVTRLLLYKATLISSPTSERFQKSPFSAIIRSSAEPVLNYVGINDTGLQWARTALRHDTIKHIRSAHVRGCWRWVLRPIRPTTNYGAQEASIARHFSLRIRTPRCVCVTRKHL